MPNDLDVRAHNPDTAGAVEARSMQIRATSPQARCPNEFGRPFFALRARGRGRRKLHRLGRSIRVTSGPIRMTSFIDGENASVPGDSDVHHRRRLYLRVPLFISYNIPDKKR